MFLVLIFAVFLGSCPNNASEEILKPLNIQAADSSSTLNENFAYIEQFAPGFGGLFFDDEGNLVVYSKQPELTTQAGVSAVEAAQVKEDILSTATTVLGDEILSLGYESRGKIDKMILSKSELKKLVKVLPADFDYGELNTWYEKTTDILATPGVVSSDLDEKANRIAFGVEDIALVETLKKKLKELGVPAEAVIFKKAESEKGGATLQDRQDSLKGGIQIAKENGGTCTLGFNAIRAGVSGFVTNSHCTMTEGKVDVGQDKIYQNLKRTNDIVGVESADPAFRADLPGCPSGAKCRLSDSAFIRYTTSRSKPLGKIAVPYDNSITINTSNPAGQSIASENVRGSLYLGLSVFKTGKTTGKTGREITETCKRVQKNDLKPAVFYVLCEMRADYPNLRGDSGSAIWTQRLEFQSCPNPPKPFNACPRIYYDLAGIHWGLSGTFSPIWDVESELGSLKTY